MSENHSDKDFVEQLRHRAEEKIAEYQRLKHDQERIAMQLQRTEEYVENLNKFLVAEGQRAVLLNVVSGANPAGRPGNRGKGMPVRKAEWHGLPLQSIVQHILEASPNEPLHAETIVEKVYEVQTRADILRAKQGLVATLRRGASNGLWEFVGHNRYKAKPTPRSGSGSLP